jgi:plasmid maintenance system antidote protein VapI
MYLDRAKMEACMSDLLLRPKRLAELANIQQNTLQSALRGKNVSTITAGKIAQALGVSARDIQKEV